MIGGEIAARGLAFAATMLLFGVSLFLVYAPYASPRVTEEPGGDDWRELRRALRRIQLACVEVAVVASATWLVIHAAIIGNEPIDRTLSRLTILTVAEETLFGRVAVLRLGLMILLGAAVTWGLRARGAAMRRIDVVTAVLAAVVLAAMAWMGHAVATLGVSGRVHLAADVVHLLVAGAWLGGLPPLALTLIRAASAGLPAGIAAKTTTRFSRLGILCVAGLVLTGTVNAWFLVERPAALFGTPYGQLLVLKLACFGLMLVLAGVNRVRLMPEIEATTISGNAQRRNAALRRLAQNAGMEVALGIAIAFVVGALGVMVPAAHTAMLGPNPPASDAHQH
jgi:putative copper resistance protein D